ncbi:hypothetical protein D3C71_2109780 [compost metagenome]
MTALAAFFAIHRQQQVLQRGQTADQISMLKDQADLLPAEDLQLLLLAEVNLLPVHLDASRRWLRQ